MTPEERKMAAEKRISERMKRLGAGSDETSAAPWLGDAGLPGQIKQKFLEDVRKKAVPHFHKVYKGGKEEQEICSRCPPFKVEGAFGEASGRDGWCEEVIKNEKGTFLRLYGCSYLLKGHLEAQAVHGIEQAKSTLFQLPLRLPLFTKIGLGFDFLFRRRKFWGFVDFVAEEVRHKTLKHYDIPPEDYSDFAREIYLALLNSIHKVFGIDISRRFYDPSHPSFSKEDPELPEPEDNLGGDYLGYILYRLARFMIFFLQTDSAYRFRIQDALGRKPRNVEEFLRFLIERETKFGVGYKWQYLLKSVKIILWFEPKLREFSDEFFARIETEKVKMDEDDIYFSLMYKSYNFGGKSFEERKAEWERINEEKGHVFLFSMPEIAMRHE